MSQTCQPSNPNRSFKWVLINYSATDQVEMAKSNPLPGNRRVVRESVISYL